MKRRFQIVMSSPSSGEDVRGPTRPTRLVKVKTWLAALAVVTIALAVLVAAIVLGYLIAAIAGVVIVVLTMVFLIRSLFRRRREALVRPGSQEQRTMR